MQYVWDEHGRRYLDALGGIVTVSIGHCHSDVVKAAHRQNETLQHSTTIYLHPNIAEYAHKLAARMPGELKVCYFVNSGSEANDLALLMARAYTGSYDVIALRNAYHGGSTLAMSLTANRAWKFNIPHSFGVHHAMTPDPYCGLWGRDDVDAGKKYAADVKNLIDYGTSGRVAAIYARLCVNHRLRNFRRVRLGRLGLCGRRFRNFAGRQQTQGFWGRQMARQAGRLGRGRFDAGSQYPRSGPKAVVATTSVPGSSETHRVVESANLFSERRI